MNKILFLLLCIVFMNGCATHLTDLSMITNKNVALSRIDLDRAPQKKNIVGKETRFVFLFIPFGVPKIQGAVNDALRRGNGDLLIDASVYAKGWWFLVGQQSIEVRGTVVKTRGN